MEVLVCLCCLGKKKKKGFVKILEYRILNSNQLYLDSKIFPCWLIFSFPHNGTVTVSSLVRGDV